MFLSFKPCPIPLIVPIVNHTYSTHSLCSIIIIDLTTYIKAPYILLFEQIITGGKKFYKKLPSKIFLEIRVKFSFLPRTFSY